MSDVAVTSSPQSGNTLVAARDFKKGEVVITYDLQPISFQELKALSPEDYAGGHRCWTV